ncbi:uncharacterized protein LDX57_008705 [Aspergillus melleus]|uniref:uncharacterized protein n=1 Tax=Aspergillus melleus TaxID=138277 RepID=UPI001E8D48DF|nr:uncharacterized protein LDX57_008705 [Aspergillus melleus]KAH8431044.1 hypothetical protein LDX57_008705 [Aspergillus melleus]
MIRNGNRLLFDRSGTSPPSKRSINFYLSEPMFKMFIGYCMIAAAAPGTVINDGFLDLIDIHIPDGTILKPSIPTESIELDYPLRIEANQSVADSGGAGFYRGGNAQRTLYRFLCRGEFSLHDDQWFTKPWGIRRGKPGSRSSKILYRYSLWQNDPPVQILPSKCDHVRVNPGDLLEWVTWGGGLEDPLTRPAEKIALEFQKGLVTVEVARDNYGVVVTPEEKVVAHGETEALREGMKKLRDATGQRPQYDRSGSMAQLMDTCFNETGLDPPRPQWELDPYGPHVKPPYVSNWFSHMRAAKGWDSL